jgi:hypothetical protein
MRASFDADVVCAFQLGARFFIDLQIADGQNVEIQIVETKIITNFPPLT